MGKKLKINNKADDDAGLGSDFWPCFVANNLIVATPEMLSLDVTDRFYKRGNLALELDLSDWLYFVGLKKQPLDIKRVYRKYKEISGLLVRKIRG